MYLTIEDRIGERRINGLKTLPRKKKTEKRRRAVLIRSGTPGADTLQK